jgi:hypothetical protein
MKTYTILNSEGPILKLEIEKFNNEPTMTFCATMNSGVGRVYFLVSENQLLEFFNSKITLSQIAQNVTEDRFLLIRYDKGYIVKKSCIVNALQCGHTLYFDILHEMKISCFDIARILSENDLIGE